MPGDSDVVRCASPWPGIAAQLLGAFTQLGPGEWTVEQLCAAVPVSITPGDALQVLSGLSITGICTRSDDSTTWSTDLSVAELTRLMTLLRGAEHFRRLRVEVPSLEVTVTMPMAPSRLAQQLPDSPGRPGGYLPTQSAFLRVAAAAQNRLVVLTPFINSKGFEWLKELCQAAGSDIEKFVVLRNVDQYAIDLAVHHADWLHAQQICIMDYYLSHPNDDNRLLPIETFHAKVVLADDRLAYIGSANMLGSGDGTSLETGVLVDGQAAIQVARLIDGILNIARHI